MIRFFVIEDEPIMAECIALAVESAELSVSGAEPAHPRAEVFNDAITAMSALQEQLPDAILLDVMLTGPDGFTFLNELISYTDTARIPVILVTTLDLSARDLAHYGVRRILNKATMTPDDIQSAVRECLTTQVETAPDASSVAPLVPGQTSLAELNRRFAALESGVATNQPSQPTSSIPEQSALPSPKAAASQPNQAQPPYAR